MNLTVAVVLAFIIQGCGGVTGPRGLSSTERATLNAARLDLRVGVRGEQGSRRDKFVDAMRERKVFRGVDSIGLISPIDLEATVTRFLNADNPLPFFTFLTLGLYPTVAKDTQRWEVTFSAPDSKQTVQVVVEFHNKTVIGWAGLFATIFPGWMFPATQDARMLDHLSLAIAKQADAIRALAGRP